MLRRIIVPKGKETTITNTNNNIKKTRFFIIFYILYKYKKRI